MSIARPETLMCNLWETWAMDSGEIHCVPRDDIFEHTHTEHCACQPEIDDESDNFYIHNSFDQRELFEEGIRKPS